MTWNLQPFHDFCVGAFKYRHHKARNPCACYAKHIISEPRLPTFLQSSRTPAPATYLQRVEIFAPATRKVLATSKNVPRPSVFNHFDFQIVLARRHGANFGNLNFQKCSEHAAWCFFSPKSLSRAGVVQILSRSTSKSAPNMPVFNDFDFRIALARRRGANFVDILGSRSSAPPRFSELPLRAFEATKLRKNTISNLRDLPATFSIVGS